MRIQGAVEVIRAAVVKVQLIRILEVNQDGIARGISAQTTTRITMIISKVRAILMMTQGVVSKITIKVMTMKNQKRLPP